MKSKLNVKQFTLLALLIAVLLLLSFTPLGYLKIGVFETTFNVIPVAVAAIALGPAGGLVTGSVFGITSFLQCLGIGGLSTLGATLLSINPFFTVITCIVPRALDGLLLGYLFKALQKWNRPTACFITGFAAAFLNTLFFMTSLMLLFGNSDYIKELQGGMNVILFICAFVGFNAITEMVTSTLLTGAISNGLFRARLISTPIKK